MRVVLQFAREITALSSTPADLRSWVEKDTSPPAPPTFVPLAQHHLQALELQRHSRATSLQLCADDSSAICAQLPVTSSPATRSSTSSSSLSSTLVRFDLRDFERDVDGKAVIIFSIGVWLCEIGEAADAALATGWVVEDEKVSMKRRDGGRRGLRECVSRT